MVLTTSPSEGAILQGNKGLSVAEQALRSSPIHRVARSTERWGREFKGRAIGLREPQRGSLIPPIEGQTRVGHQLVGSEPRRLLPCKDRGDNIRSEKSQPHKARRVRSRDPFFVRDGLERRTVRFEHSLGDLLTTHEQSDQGRIRWRRIGDALDDELHLLAGSLQARANAEPDQSLFGPIRIRARRPTPFDDPLAWAVVQKPTDQTRRADLNVNAIRVHLCPDKDGAGKIVLRLGRQILPPSR